MQTTIIMKMRKKKHVKKQIKKQVKVLKSAHAQQNVAVADPQKKRKKRTIDKSKIGLSWLTKIGNAEFGVITDELLNSIEKLIKGKCMILDVPFSRARANLDQMLAMHPKQEKHALTETIQEMHAERKRQISTLRSYLKMLMKPHIAKANRERAKAAETLLDMFQLVLGTRHYDLGISTLRSKMQMIHDEIKVNKNLQDAVILCNIENLMDSLEDLHKTFETNYLTRDKHEVSRSCEPSFSELRTKIYKDICLIISLVDYLMGLDDGDNGVVSTNNDIYLQVKIICLNILTTKRANYLRQKSKRKMKILNQR